VVKGFAVFGRKNVITVTKPYDNLSVQSNKNFESKQKSMESRSKKRAVQNTNSSLF